MEFSVRSCVSQMLSEPRNVYEGVCATCSRHGLGFNMGRP